MSGFLIDTSVLSELAPGRRRDDDRRWFRENDGNLFLSVVVISEIGQGIARLRRTGASRKAEMLAVWFNEMLEAFSDTIIPVDRDIAFAAGELSDRANGLGIDPGYPDILIAATAARRHLTIATRNLRHFRPLDVPCFDPFLQTER